MSYELLLEFKDSIAIASDDRRRRVVIRSCALDQPAVEGGWEFPYSRDEIISAARYDLATRGDQSSRVRIEDEYERMLRKPIRELAAEFQVVLGMDQAESLSNFDHVRAAVLRAMSMYPFQDKLRNIGWKSDWNWKSLEVGSGYSFVCTVPRSYDDRAGGSMTVLALLIGPAGSHEYIMTISASDLQAHPLPSDFLLQMAAVMRPLAVAN